MRYHCGETKEEEKENRLLKDLLIFFFLNLKVQSRSLSLSFSYLLLIITESQNHWDVQESPTKII